MIDVPDGMDFQADMVRAVEIRKEANYAGIRVTLLGLPEKARCPVQVDIGFGDAVTPGPEGILYPVILEEFYAPKLRAYPRYTVVAEKVEALSSLGIANSRMKDFFDLWILAQHAEFDGETLRQAIGATFECRGTALPPTLPLGLSEMFARDPRKRTQWEAFLRKNALEMRPFGEVVTYLSDFLAPALRMASNAEPFPFHWPPGGPWTPLAKD